MRVCVCVRVRASPPAVAGQVAEDGVHEAAGQLTRADEERVDGDQLTTEVGGGRLGHVHRHRHRRHACHTITQQ